MTVCPELLCFGEVGGIEGGFQFFHGEPQQRFPAGAADDGGDAVGIARDDREIGARRRIGEPRALLPIAQGRQREAIALGEAALAQHQSPPNLRHIDRVPFHRDHPFANGEQPTSLVYTPDIKFSGAATNRSPRNPS
jgi:hypothetical protein